MSFDPGLIAQYAPLMLSGLWTTAYVCALSSMIALAFGLALAVGLLSSVAPIRVLCLAYVEIMRGTPVLVVLFLIYYGGPSLGIVLDPAPAGILGLGFYTAAYFAEIFRAGFQSIPQGQVEAARMVGLSHGRIMRRIKLPQMAALIVPPAINQLIILVKESALVSIITVADLTKNATQMANETFAVLEPFLLVALLYWLLIEGLAQLGGIIERRMRWTR
jgi:polar amino acid transport system permease protein